MAEKSTRWSFTAYEGQYSVIDALAQQRHELIAEIGWQDEVCPKTQKKHRQGYVRTVRQCRFKQLSTVMPGIHLEVAKNWNALVAYCRKTETRDPSGSQVAVQYERPMRLHEMLMEVAHNIYLIHPVYGKSAKNPSRLDSQTDRRLLNRLLVEYSESVVRNHPEYAIVLSRQDAKAAWCDFIELWMAKAAEREGEGQ